MISEAGLLAAGVFLLAISGTVLFLGGRRRKKNIIEIDLEADWELRHLAPLWTRDGLVRKISLDDLARIWRADEQKEECKSYSPKLEGDRARRFYATHIGGAPFFEKYPEQKRICAQLLELLDREGECPSVVDTIGQSEAFSEAKAYRELARISLLDHSLNVALAMIEILTERKLRYVLADGLVAALAHDLGKLPSLRQEVYATGDHPITSGGYLHEKIEGFKKLPRREEILQAVKQHHSPYKNMGLLAETLVLADRQARERELEGIADTGKGLNEKQGGSPAGGPSYTLERRKKKIIRLFLPPELEGEGAKRKGPEAAAAKGEGVQEAPVPEGRIVVEEEKAADGPEEPARDSMAGGREEKSAEEGLDTFLAELPPLSGETEGSEPEKQKSIHSGVSQGAGPEAGGKPAAAKEARVKEFRMPDLDAAEVMAWYDEGILKREIRRAVNIVTDGRWTAFSMPDGYVYCQPPVLGEATRKMAENAGYGPIITMARDDLKGMRPYLLALVNHLRAREEEIIARRLLREGYFGAFFNVAIEEARTGTIRTTKGYYTPFHAEWLGTVADFEKAKPARLKRIKSVKPAVN